MAQLGGFAHLSWICLCGMGVSLTWLGHLAVLHSILIHSAGLPWHAFPVVVAEAQGSSGDVKRLSAWAWNQPTLILLFSIDQSPMAESRVRLGKYYQVTRQKVRMQEG